MDLTAETLRLWLMINMAQKSVHGAIETVLKTQKLPPLPYFDVLWALHYYENGVRPFELEKTLLFEQSNLSKLLRRMVLEGLIEEKPYEKDKRGKVVTITQKGIDVRTQMWAAYGAIIHKHIGKVSENFDAIAVTKALRSIVPEEVLGQFVDGDILDIDGRKTP